MAGRGGEYPPLPPVQRLTLSFLSQPLRGEDLSSVVAYLCVVFTSVEFAGFSFGDILRWNHISVNFPSFSLARLVRMSHEQRLCPGNGDKKCGAVMSPYLGTRTPLVLGVGGDVAPTI